MVGRLGCLMAGCCYGKPTTVAWAITFTDPAANFNVGTPLNVPLHPTQLYESAAGLVILLALLAIERRANSYAGRTFWSFVGLYAVLRFVIEFYRGDDRGLVFGAISTSQFISLILLPLSLFMLWYLGRPERPAAPEVPRGPRKPRFA
jgi:phosphatidylglycerol:prolipoprotein diacylglycerol transferase